MDRVEGEMKRGSQVNERGFTLVESAVASAILSIGILAVAALSFNIVTLLARTGSSTLAINLATSTMEGLEVGLPPDGDVSVDAQLPFSEVTGTSDPFYFNRIGESVEDETTARFMVMWVATPHSSGLYTDIRVTTYWNRIGPAPTEPEEAVHAIRLQGRVMLP